MPRCFLREIPLQLRHNGRDSVSNHQPHHCFLNRLFRHRSKKTSKLRVIGLCAGNSPGTDEFPTQMASDAENVSIWWRHYAKHESEFILAVNTAYSILTREMCGSVSRISEKIDCIELASHVTFYVRWSVNNAQVHTRPSVIDITSNYHRLIERWLIQVIPHWGRDIMADIFKRIYFKYNGCIFLQGVFLGNQWTICQYWHQYGDNIYLS